MTADESVASDARLSARVRQALEGALPSAELDAAESAVFDAVVEERVRNALAIVDITAERRARGMRSVSLDDTGQMIEHRPDGSTRPFRAG